MARFSGAVGYESVQVETTPGVWVGGIVEKQYFGDVTKDTRVVRGDEGLHDSLTVRNSISIVADAYANEHYHAIRFVEWAGGVWKVDDVEVQRPRLLLRLGGVYNGPRADS